MSKKKRAWKNAETYRNKIRKKERQKETFKIEEQYLEIINGAEKIKSEFAETRQKRSEVLERLYESGYALLHRANQKGDSNKVMKALAYKAKIAIRKNTVLATIIVKAFMQDEENRSLVCRYSNAMRAMYNEKIEPQNALEKLREGGGYADWSMRCSENNGEGRRPTPRKLRPALRLSKTVLNELPEEEVDGIFFGSIDEDGCGEITAWGQLSEKKLEAIKGWVRAISSKKKDSEETGAQDDPFVLDD